MEVKFLDYQGWLVVNANRGPKPEEKGGWYRKRRWGEQWVRW